MISKIRHFVASVLLAIGLSLVTSVPALAQPAPEAPRPATVHLLDVGQGDAVLITSPEGRTALIDAGRSDSVVDVLRGLGVTTIDLVGVSHQHTDHFGGMDAVIREFTPKFYMATTSDHGESMYADLLEVVRDAELQVISISPGDASRRITLGTVVLTTLPQPPDDDANENNNSIGLRIEHGEATMLITGDSEDAERTWWLDPAHGAVELIRDVDVFKLAHHGSENGIDLEWLELVRPKLAVVSLGAGNPFGHPHEETMELVADAGIPLRRTDIHRTITLASFGERFGLVEGEPPEPPTEKLDLNGATEEELDKLPGIGATLARRIVEGRPYESADDLLRVNGIGPTRLEILRPLVEVRDP